MLALPAHVDERIGKSEPTQAERDYLGYWKWCRSLGIRPGSFQRWHRGDFRRSPDIPAAREAARVDTAVVAAAERSGLANCELFARDFECRWVF